jgi:exodeoxyribonuclease V alpha subunit
VTAQASVAVDVRSFAPGPYGGGIAHGSDDAGRAWSVLLRSSTFTRAPQPGERWRFAGELRQLEDAAGRLEATLALPLAPRGQGIVRYLATNPRIAGVGRAYAQKLWNHFGEDLYALLRTRDADALSHVVGPFLAANIVCGWGLYIDDVEAFAWLDACGVAPRTAAAAVALWGAQVREKISEDPYALGLLEPWQSVDQAALRAGVFPDDDRRLLAAVEEASARRFARKHTATTLDELATELRVLVGPDEAMIARALGLARSSGRLLPTATEPETFQTRGPHEMERLVRSVILERTEHSIAANTMLRDQATAAAGASGLNELQQRAVSNALTCGVSVLCGGAGTGKTTTLKAIVGALKARYGQAYPVYQVALAGRAARRMADATGYEAATIYRFLLDVRAGRAPVDSGLLIIDEASMLDLPTVYSVLRSVSPSMRLLFVGDPAQLPPIGSGLVFHRMAASSRLPRVELTEIHRQRSETGIPQGGALIRAGHYPRPRVFDFAQPHSIGLFIHRASHSVAHETLRVFEAIAGAQVAIGARERDLQMLCATRRGPTGTQALNTEVERRHLPKSGRALAWGLSVGSRILWTTNDHQRGTQEAPRSVLNGTLGTITALASEHITAEFDDGTVDTLRRKDLVKLDRGWAISVHKAQGSAFQHVVIPIVESRLLDRTLVYTAVTHAVRSVVLVGDDAQLRAAIENAPNALLRRVALSF